MTSDLRAQYLQLAATLAAEATALKQIADAASERGEVKGPLQKINRQLGWRVSRGSEYIAVASMRLREAVEAMPS